MTDATWNINGGSPDNESNRSGAPVTRRARPARRVALLLVFALLVWACARDPRLVGKDLRDPTVRSVTHYGRTLGTDATPEEVAYVALRAIHDDFRAADAAERERALDVQYDVCAANVIADSNRSSLTRPEHLYRVVNLWTPTVSHYADDFPPGWEEANKRLVLRMGADTATGKTGDSSRDPDRCTVLIEVDDVPAERDPAARVVIAVYLARDKGLWRVTHLGFDAPKDRRGRRRILPARPDGENAGAESSSKTVVGPEHP